jgi:hypothetical protein
LISCIACDLAISAFKDQRLRELGSTDRHVDKLLYDLLAAGSLDVLAGRLTLCVARLDEDRFVQLAQQQCYLFAPLATAVVFGLVG